MRRTGKRHISPYVYQSPVRPLPPPRRALRIVEAEEGLEDAGKACEGWRRLGRFGDVIAG